jgi:hypothetical protein
MQKLESKFKHQLDNYSSNVELDSMWENIDHKLRPKKSKRIFFFILGMILIAGTLGYFLFPETNSKNTKIISKNLEGDQNVSNSNEQALAKPNINNLKSLTVEKKEVISDKFLIKRHNSNTNTNNIYSTNLEKDKQIQSQLINDKIKTNKIEPEATSTEINKNNIVNFDPHDTKNENNKEFTIENKQNIFNNQDSIQKIISDPVEVSAQIITENLKQDTIQKLHNAMKPQIQNTNYVNQNISTSLKDSNANIKSIQFYISLLSGLSYAHRTLKPAYPTEDKDWIQKRVETEKSLETQHYCLLLEAILKDKIRMKTGFEYIKINERYYNEIPRSRISQNETRNGYIVNLKNDTSYFRFNFDAQKDSIFAVKVYNYYNLYNIPFKVSFTFLRTNKFDVYFGAGVSINLSHQYKSMIMNKTLEAKLYRSTTSTDSPFRSRIQMLPSFELGTSYMLNNKFGLSAMLQYNKIISITKADYSIKQSYDLYGLNLGIFYKL